MRPTGSLSKCALPWVAVLVVGTVASAAQPPPLDDKSDADLMLLSVRVDSEVIAEVLPTALTADGALVPLGELSRDLGFAITVKPDEGLAEGWAFSEQRRFLLHLQSGTASFDGAPIAFGPGDVQR